MRGECTGMKAATLQVDAPRALRLGWAPRLRLDDALAWTVEWYRRLAAGEERWT